MERETALPEAQLEVMEVIWDRGGSVMFADLSSELEARGKEWKANTILTLLARLAERGMVSVCKRGRLNEYHGPGFAGGLPADAGPQPGGPGVRRQHKASHIRPRETGVSDKRRLR